MAVQNVSKVNETASASHQCPARWNPNAVTTSILFENSYFRLRYHSTFYFHCCKLFTSARRSTPFFTTAAYHKANKKPFQLVEICRHYSSHIRPPVTSGIRSKLKQRDRILRQPIRITIFEKPQRSLLRILRRILHSQSEMFPQWNSSHRPYRYFLHW